MLKLYIFSLRIIKTTTFYRHSVLNEINDCNRLLIKYKFKQFTELTSLLHKKIPFFYIYIIYLYTDKSMYSFKRNPLSFKSLH